MQKPDIVAPGSSIISLRDEDIYTVPNSFFVDNDGNPSGSCDYMVMEGTSMSAPFCAGAAALFLEKFPDALPEEVYDALRSNAVLDEFTGSTASTIYGYGKLDIYSAMDLTENPLPVELNSFSASCRENIVNLKWTTSTEVNNYGWEIERSQKSQPKADQPLAEEVKSQKDDPVWEKIGFMQGHGNSNSPREYFFNDKNLNAGNTYQYRLKQIDNDGSYKYSEEITIRSGMPGTFQLEQNYPNPFNPSTNFEFQIPDSDENKTGLVLVTLKIYDLLGEEVAALVNEEKQAGKYKISFNASGLPSGTYFYTLQAGNYTATKKMIYLK
jgi:hypothetical protein